MSSPIATSQPLINTQNSFIENIINHEKEKLTHELAIAAFASLALVFAASAIGVPFFAIPLLPVNPLLQLVLGLGSFYLGLYFTGQSFKKINLERSQVHSCETKLENSDYQQLIELENGSLTQKTKELFRKFGKHVKKLDLSQVKTAFTVVHFFDIFEQKLEKLYQDDLEKLSQKLFKDEREILSQFKKKFQDLRITLIQQKLISTDCIVNLIPKIDKYLLETTSQTIQDVKDEINQAQSDNNIDDTITLIGYCKNLSEVKVNNLTQRLADFCIGKKINSVKSVFCNQFIEQQLLRNKYTLNKTGSEANDDSLYTFAK